MTALQGELAFMPAADLFRYLANRRFSGTLTARRGADEKRIVLLEGKAVEATSSDPREYVGQFLLHHGKIVEEELDRSFQAQAATKVPLGRLLVQGGLDEGVVKEALELKVRETALDLCAWTEGQFTVVRTEVRADQSGVAVTPVALTAIITEAQTRAKQWVAIRAIFPDGNVRVEAASGASAAGRPKGSVDARILALLTEPRSVDEIGLFLHSTEFQVYSRLHALVQEGAIRLAPLTNRTPGAPAGQPGAGGQLDAARKALRAGAIEEAVEAARKAMGLDASADAVATLRQAEAVLLEKLRADLVATPSKPKATVDLSKLRELPISPPARYLLTRMNGERELASILRVAPMREVDALEIVQRMMRDGWIRVDDR